MAYAPCKASLTMSMNIEATSLYIKIFHFLMFDDG